MAKKVKEWNNIINEYWKEGPVAFVPTKELKETLGEVRLYTKIDRRKDLPKPLKKRNISLLPLKNRGDYALVKGDMFTDIAYNQSSKKWNNTQKLELATLNGDRIGEQKYISKALWTGILSDFLNIDKTDIYQTIGGREYTKPFEYSLNNNRLEVESVQIEIDAGFEIPSRKEIVILEAKKRSRDKLKSFNIRQLYYPYRQYQKKFPEHTIRTIFFLHDEEDQYNLWEYEFQDSHKMDTISCKKSTTYRIPKVKKISLWDVHKRSTPKYDIVPQADDIEKVLQIPYLVNAGVKDAKESLESLKDLNTKRQGNYYRQASDAIGLTKKWNLTEKGKEYINLRTEDTERYIVERMLENKIINIVLTTAKTRKVSKKDVAEIIFENNTLTRETANRRKTTVISWIKWLASNSSDLKVVDKQINFMKE